MRFEVEGPFKIKRFSKKKLITRESKENLTEEAEAQEEGLSEACGCYVVGVRAGRGIKPIYAGQAFCSTIVDEALSDSNIGKYNTALADHARGNPVIFLLPWVTNGGRYRKRARNPRATSDILNFVEEWLIGAALQKNAGLINNKKTRFLREVHITGIFNPKRGEATLESGRLKAALSL